MRTTLRSLAISSLGLTGIVLMLAGVAEARTRPHYGGVVRIESSAAADATGLVTETLTSVDALGRVRAFTCGALGGAERRSPLAILAARECAIS